MHGLASAWGRSLLLNLLTGIMWSPIGAELARIRWSQPFESQRKHSAHLARMRAWSLTTTLRVASGAMLRRVRARDSSCRWPVHARMAWRGSPSRARART